MDTKARLEQVLRDRTIANDAFNKEILAIKVKLAEEAKPKKVQLRHGDYGVRTKQGNRPIIMTKSNTNSCIVAGGIGGMWDHDCREEDYEEKFCLTQGYVKLGNIFDDIKANSEDLREFTGCYMDGESKMNVRLYESCKFVEFKIDNAHFTPTFDETIKIHQKLGQMIAFGKRELAKSK